MSAQAGYTRTNHVDEFGIPLPTAALRIIYPDVPDNYRTRARRCSGRSTPAAALDALERAAARRSDATGADLDAARADLRLEVTRAYWAVVTAREAVRVLEESLAADGRARSRDVRNRSTSGLVPPNDVLVDRGAAVARSELLLIEAREPRRAVARSSSAG